MSAAKHTPGPWFAGDICQATGWVDVFTREEDGERSLPFVSCKHHLYLDVSQRTGSIKLNFPDLEVWEMTTSSCALDVADEGGATLESVGSILNVTRERVRQLELAALARLASVRDMKHLRDWVSEDSP